MKLSTWARQQGVQYKTAHRWFQKGILPVPARQLPTGTILVEVQSAQPLGGVALYARVSSAEQKEDLDRQLGRLAAYAVEQGFGVTKTVREVGSGLNGKRPQLLRLLGDSSVSTLIVEHRDRLARFGSEYIEAALHASNRRLVVIDSTEVKDDLVQDVVAVMTSLCARLYGKRAAKNRARRAVAVALEEGA